MAADTDHQPHGRPPRTAAWLLLLPLLVWLAVFVIAPVAIMIVYSFARPGEVGGVKYEFSLESYRTILSLPLLAALAWAALWAAAGAALVMVVAWGVGRLWPWWGDWLGRRWRFVLILLMVLIGWGFFRHHVISRVQAQNVEQMTEAQQKAKQSLALIKVFVVSIDYAVWSTAICVLIGYPVAYFMGRAPPGVRYLLLLLIMVPFWTSFLIRTYAWVTILKPQGVLNSFLLWTRMVSEPLDLMYSPTAVMIGLVYTYLPFMILPIFTSCERLDQALIEASFDLGANPFRSFWTVILPLTWPGVMAGIVITFIPAIGQFAVNDILGGKTEPLIGNVITNQFNQARNWPQGAALGMALMAMFVVTYYLAARKRGTVVG